MYQQAIIAIEIDTHKIMLVKKKCAKLGTMIREVFHRPSMTD